MGGACDHIKAKKTLFILTSKLLYHSSCNTQSRENASLSPVPEALEGDDEEVREKRRDEESMPTTKSSTLPRSTGSAAHRALRTSNTSTSTLGSQQSSTTDLTKKGTFF